MDFHTFISSSDYFTLTSIELNHSRPPVYKQTGATESLYLLSIIILSFYSRVNEKHEKLCLTYARTVKLILCNTYTKNTFQIS